MKEMRHLHRCYCLIALISAFNLSAGGEPTPNLSTRAKELAAKRWSTNSFDEGMAVVLDRTETPESRGAAMEILHVNRRKLSVNELKRLYDVAASIAKDSTEPVPTAAHAIRVMADTARLAKDTGQALRVDIKADGSFFVELAGNMNHDVALRSEAIDALGVLKISEGSRVIRDVLKIPGNLDQPQLARSACLALLRIDDEKAASPLSEVLSKTRDESVFGTAAFALGQIKTAESLSVLVENSTRFPDSGACGAVIVDMDGVALSILKRPNHPQLLAAIHATQLLWRDGQREHYIPALQSLLVTAPQPARKAAVERLIEAARTKEFVQEKRELQAVEAAIQNQAELSEYLPRIRARLSAIVLTPSTVETPTPVSESGGR